MVFWNNIIIKPLKIFTVFLHELGHTLMAFSFGFGIEAFKVNFNESGYVIAKPKGFFSSVMIANGGYLGSVLFAVLILYLKRTKLKKFILGFLAIIFLAVAIGYSGISLTLLFAAVFASIVIIVYMVNNEKLTDWLIDILGISSVAYAIYDTFVDTILMQFFINNKMFLFGGSAPVTDAVRLAQMTHIPAIVWGIIWIAISILAVKIVVLKPANLKARK